MKTSAEIQVEFQKLLEQRSAIDNELLKLQGEYRYAYQLEQENKETKEETREA